MRNCHCQLCPSCARKHPQRCTGRTGYDSIIGAALGAFGAGLMTDKHGRKLLKKLIAPATRLTLVCSLRRWHGLCHGSDHIEPGETVESSEATWYQSGFTEAAREAAKLMRAKEYEIITISRDGERESVFYERIDDDG